jgi:hypothetical protein
MPNNKKHLRGSAHSGKQEQMNVNIKANLVADNLMILFIFNQIIKKMLKFKI